MATYYMQQQLNQGCKIVENSTCCMTTQDNLRTHHRTQDNQRSATDERQTERERNYAENDLNP